MNDPGQAGYDGPFLANLVAYRGPYVEPVAAPKLHGPDLMTERPKRGRPRKMDIAAALADLRERLRAR